MTGSGVLAVNQAAQTERRPVGRRPLRSALGLLTTVRLLSAATGLLSGPLLARALGAAGRGDLTAVQTPVLLAPAIIGLGIPAFAYRELPRGRPPQELLASLVVPQLLIGALAMVAAVPVADLLAGSRETVRTYLIIGFMLMPIMLVGSLLTSALVAMQRWRAVIASTVFAFSVPFAGTVILYVLGDLTVGWASALTIAGALAGTAPALPMVLSLPRPVFRPRLACEGVAYGVRAWLGGLALLANARLDQLLMITVVAPRVLGLYAVATTLAGATGLITGALGQTLVSRVASGERMLIVRAVRLTLIVAAVLNLMIAAIAPVLLPGLFGPDFRAAVPLTWVLLIGAVPFGATSVISTTLQADGAPTIPSIAEVIALVVTVGGLAVFLRPFGGMGAAVVSDVAYTTSFGYQVFASARRLRVPANEFLVPTWADARWLIDEARTAAGMVTRRLGWQP